MWASVLFLYLMLHINAGAEPVFLKMPSSQSALKGSQISYECQIDVSSPSYQWLKDGSNITKGSISLTGSVSSLVVNNLKFSDAGNYTCVAKDTQSGQEGERTGTLAVKGKPTIVQAPSVLAAYVGQSGEFHCVAVGDPNPTVRWKNSSVIITTGGRFEVFINGSLKINNLLKSDDGSLYICEAENSYGITTASATLQVHDPPTPPSFTVKPVNQTATEGGRVTFYCAASGNPSPKITWRKFQGSLPADRRQEPSPGSLRIVNLQPEDDALYLCTAQNLVAVLTAAAFLRIEGYPRITAGPSNKVVVENSSLQFHCMIEGDPTPYVEWTTPNGAMVTLLSPLSNSTRVLANNSLSIAMVTEVDAGRYMCTAVNRVGRRSVQATLKVLAPPRFSSPLKNKTSNVNSKLVVDCGARGVPVPYYQWLFNGLVITQQQTLNLSLVNVANQGFYTCIANNSLGLVEGSFYLTVQAPPVFIKSPKNQTIPKGQTATFPCSATGDPTPSISWYKSNSPVNTGANFVILSNGTLLVTRVTQLNSGWFTCQAENQAGTREVKAFLLVADFPVFTSTPINTSVEEGSSLTLSCRAHGPDKPVITWLIDDGSGIAVVIVMGIEVLVDSSGDLKYTKVTSKNRGLHICKACNTAGCRTAKAFLDVLFAPRFPVSPPPVYVLKGSTAVLECRPESNPPAVISWMRNGQNLPGNGNLYSVSNVQPADEGMYKCKARNNRGTAEGDVQLAIGTTAEINDFVQTSSEIDKVLMHCIVEGNPSPKVTWYLGDTKLPDKLKYADYDVTSDNKLRVPSSSLGSLFLCNCTNPLNSVAKLAKIPESPSQVSITSIMETSLEVTWTPADPLDLVLQYMVEVKNMSGAWKPITEIIQGTSVVVNNLKSFTAYTFRVRAKNGLGTSNYSHSSRNVTTLEGAPSAPRELELTAKNASVVFASWLIPAMLNGYQQSILYRIHFTPQNGNTSGDLFVAHSTHGSPQIATLPGLFPDSVYSIKIYAGRRRSDGVERWSPPSSKTVRTWQLIPFSPPLDLTAESNGAYQIMVKWKAPSYSIAGYNLWYKKHKSTAAYTRLKIVGMSNTVHLILELEPNTEYEVKARMYSNAGIGPFSETLVVKTDTNAFAESSKMGSEEESSGLLVAVICAVIGVLLLLGLFVFVCAKQRQSSPSRQSFHIENLSEDPSLKYIIQNRDPRGRSTSRTSTSNESDGSVEGTYNFAAVDDEIDEQMFAGDRNSMPAQNLRLRYLNPTEPSHAPLPSSEYTEVEAAVRLQNYQPRVSPEASRKDGITVVASVEVNQVPGESSGLAITKSKDSAAVEREGSSSEEECGPPDWVPPPPPVDTRQPQVHKDLETRRTSPDISAKDPAEYSATGPTSSEPPIYAQVDLSKKKNRLATKESPRRAKNELLTNGSSQFDGDTSEDDSISWPPPPPPPHKSANPTDDPEWERPLPPEIMALPGKRNRVALWADSDDESENNDSDIFVKI